jgi:hypothetical protein
VSLVLEGKRTKRTESLVFRPYGTLVRIQGGKGSMDKGVDGGPGTSLINWDAIGWSASVLPLAHLPWLYIRLGCGVSPHFAVFSSGSTGSLFFYFCL